ncbi:hypothetical protein MBAV_002140, partial [Candidatus Magnetobacterium bavaricum]
MGVALGKGISFIEKHIDKNTIPNQKFKSIQESTYQYFGRNLAIDDRPRLLDMITSGGLLKNSFVIGVILDDATETVDELLWMLDVMEQFPFFKVYLIVNTAQVSVNFSSNMLNDVLKYPYFAPLARRLGTQLLIREIYCPFISFQINYLPSSAREVIELSDAIYVKGANFFETCQIPQKDTFYAFVVYGPVSRAYTGLRDYDAVFAYT